MATAQNQIPVASVFKFQEPCTKLTGQLGGVNPIAYDLSQYNRISTLFLKQSITRAAVAAGTPQAPQFTDALSAIVLKVGSVPQRTRLASDLFGAQGLNALCDFNGAGSVVYTQAGNANLSVIPVLIGSAADTAQRALVTQNVACSALFVLPINFTENFRKEYASSEAMALITRFSDGSTLGVTTLEIQTAPQIAAPAVTINSLTLDVLYDDSTRAAGTANMLSKEYRHAVPYAAAGDLEVALQLPLNSGMLQRLSLLTTADQITKVVVKLNNRLIRVLTRETNAQVLATSDYNLNAVPANRFDIEFDLNDHPASALPLDPTSNLSITATLATANDATKAVSLLSSFWGQIG